MTRTITAGSVLVYQDGVPLVNGIDYRFGYDATTNVIRLTPLAGVFSSSSVYQIRFINSREFAVIARAGRDYTDGATITVVDNNNVSTVFELDTGYRLTVPAAADGSAAITDGGVLTVDDGVRRLTFELDTNAVLSSTITSKSRSPQQPRRRLSLNAFKPHWLLRHAVDRNGSGYRTVAD